MSLSYTLKRISQMNYGQMWRAVRTAHARCHKNSLFLLFDMIRCGFQYGAGYTDYNCFAFYTLNPAQRTTYITRKWQNQLVAKLNQKEYYPYFVNKELFNQTFREFIRRGYLNLAKANKEAFAVFLAGRNSVIVKPIEGMGGKGVKKIKIGPETDSDALYEELKTAGLCLVEETVVQHPEIAAIYPHSVNTVRIMTVLDGEHVDLVFAALRMGSGRAVVDNMVAGGMCALIDIETGIICRPAANLNNQVFERHPDTQQLFVGTIIPHFDQVRETVEKAALIIPQIRYVGWDVAITPDGVELIEGNEFPCHQLMQEPAHLENGEGLLPRLKKYV